MKTPNYRNSLGSILLLSSAFLILSSCEKDEDPPVTPPVNEEELITTLNLTLVDGVANDTVVFTFRDLDGDGGNAPVITGGTINSGVSYSGSIEVLNEVDGEDITLEILDEAEEHQFFFDVGSTGIIWSYDDTDADGKPIGLETNWNAPNTGSGSIKVTLRHEPDKSAGGVSMGDITNAGGETDIEVDLPVTIQ